MLCVEPVERDLLRQQADEVVTLGVMRVQDRPLAAEGELRVPGDARTDREDQLVVSRVLLDAGQ